MNEKTLFVLALSFIFLFIAFFKINRENFYLGSGKYGPGVSAVSIMAAFAGGGAIINTSQLSSQFGYWALFDVLSVFFALILASFLAFIGFFGKKFSQEFFSINRDHFDKPAVILHYIEIGILYIFVIAAQLRGVALFAETLGVPVFIAVPFVCVTVALYAHRGFSAVTRTDFVQFIGIMLLAILLGSAWVFQIELSEQSAVEISKKQMPLSLIISLSLVVIFAPISQEIHQRGAASVSDSTLKRSYVLAAFLYLFLGASIVAVFSTSGLNSVLDLVQSSSPIVAYVAIFAMYSALLSTIDTSTNISAHAWQQMPRLRNLPPLFLQCLCLSIAGVLFLFFSEILSILLVAIFIYISGPAMNFGFVYFGVHPRMSSWIALAFVTSHVLVHIRFSEYFGGDAVEFWINDPKHISLLLLVLQFSILLAVGLYRRL